ncbi:hypothetical protein [Thermocoleostomius sinensis]|uniref:Uncharacterized protein n=1 Tax=Thermocoleostomius sinensis A174 TaxID=2016057 RepID=A0A9E9CAY8_9CYAN|nr:hypothetical protein [Thermocoleostomius sinensis]WAL61607.1 hypothetical protein OXH18_06375 [Thermocoleostomius sinensis A174]
MDLLHDQMAALNDKVDALHQTIEELGGQVTEILSEVKLVTADKNPLQPGAATVRQSYQSRRLDEELEHKDVLSDFTYLETDSQSGERTLAPEVQIQRLTAQLTAAYNRIAALEEQLLSKRIH